MNDVAVLERVDFNVHPAEVHAVAGEYHQLRDSGRFQADSLEGTALVAKDNVVHVLALSSALYRKGPYR
jgi:hypothetical protein